MPNTNKYHLGFYVKKKHVMMTFYGPSQISMKLSAGQCAGFAPLLWGPWLDVVLVGTLTGTREVGCDLGLQAWKKPVLNLSLTGCVTLLNSASFSVQWG